MSRKARLSLRRGKVPPSFRIGLLKHSGGIRIRRSLQFLAQILLSVCSIEPDAMGTPGFKAAESKAGSASRFGQRSFPAQAESQLPLKL